MYYTTHIILVLLLYQLIHTRENKETFRGDMRHLTTDIVRSFETLQKTVIYFFKASIIKFEKKRKQIKKAVSRLINEVFYNIPPCSLRLTVDRDIASDVLDLIIQDGYQVDMHTVLTSDGYLLTVHRIFSTLTNSTGDRNVVILGHGLMGSSIDWIMLGPTKALPYLLSDAGYDVWLPNFRGNKYSKAHVTKNIDSAEFWNFSWHEIGLFDIPAVIDYVKETTVENAAINFIAYCMSGSALLVLLSSSQIYNAKLKSATLVAPLVYMDNIKGPLYNLAELYSRYKNDIDIIMNIESEFKPDEIFDNSKLALFCKVNKYLCKNPLQLVGGGEQDKSLRTSGGSTKTLVHYLQLIKTGQFRMYDYGEAKNNLIYGTASPPFYHLFNIKLPLILFNAINDSISTVPDLAKFMLTVPDVINHPINAVNFSHLDFLWDESATQLVYLPLIKKLLEH